MRRRPYAVLFDLDGTLVDSIGLLVASMEYAFEGRRRRPTVEQWLALIGTPLDAMLDRWADGPEDVQALRGRYREHQLVHHDAMVTAYPGVTDTVRALHDAGHPLAVVTSKLEAGARRSLRHVGIEDCFTAVVGIDATDRHKPEPEPVLHALHLLADAPTGRAAFVGDSTHDIHAGNAAGVETIAATWGPYSRDALAAARPTHWIERMADLPPLIRMLEG